MADETVRERALLVYALEYQTSNVIASEEPAGLLACERAGFVEGYLRAHADTLSAVLDELRAERTEWKGDAPREALARQLPHLLACAKFVEEHGEQVDAGLERQGWRHRHRGGSWETDPSKPARDAFEALRRSRSGGGT